MGVDDPSLDVNDPRSLVQWMRDNDVIEFHGPKDGLKIVLGPLMAKALPNGQQSPPKEPSDVIRRRSRREAYEEEFGMSIPDELVDLLP